jgi:broad specificity phosphatase PhoE
VRQAEALPAALERFPIDRLVSSPHLRCTQTLAPLAAARGLAVEQRAEVAEGAGRGDVAALLAEIGAAAALICTHGDVLELLLGEPTRKGETTVVEPTSEGLRVLARIPPPA